MVSVDRVLSEFIDDWNAGRRPRVEDYLARVDPALQHELAAEISTWMEVAPTPSYDDAARAEIQAEPAVRAAQDAFGTRAGLWPALLPRLRARAKLSLDALAERTSQTMGFEGREQKVRRYLDEMEQGSLDAQGVSSRVLEALAGILGVSAAELRRTGALSGPAVAPASAAFFRADAPDTQQLAELELMADAILAPAPGDWDEVDEAFQGGG